MESSKELFLLVVTLGAGVLLFGTAMFMVEALSVSETNGLVFNNIPTAMWWAVITRPLLGKEMYGDYVTMYAGRYLVRSACAIAGLLLVAMPVAIVASNFSSFHDNMTSRNQSIRRGFLMAKIKYLRTENAKREGSRVKEERGGGVPREEEEKEEGIKEYNGRLKGGGNGGRGGGGGEGLGGSDGGGWKDDSEGIGGGCDQVKAKGEKAVEAEEPEITYRPYHEKVKRTNSLSAQGTDEEAAPNSKDVTKSLDRRELKRTNVRNIHRGKVKTMIVKPRTNTAL
ncbi:potassium voltage-gated channel subfamily a member 4 [Plakobranchus ocellatus]|uniref:Potassium voltage-gated channel subfamily a member 4 n=1 Tax=Plakobranchus ocellatus TaxID=259542 RepID=A0AAV4CM85_9GAST|nr:potassium voltage-gated channel subfamily a member 4 [Plakobranchus ocellatus]